MMYEAGECRRTWEQKVDRALVERAQHGDRDAYASIATNASHRLFAVALRILRDHDAARDALQTTLVEIWRDLPDLRDPERFEAWSYRLVVNACNAAQRRARRTIAAAESLPSSVSVGDSQSQVALRDELERAFMRLTVDQRAVLVLQYYQDLSVAEIATSLGVSPGTVKSRLHAARRVMRAAIDADSRLPISAEELA
jgi:RNA polymerase sigma-70 factor (ECF subfamily)